MWISTVGRPSRPGTGIFVSTQQTVLFHPLNSWGADSSADDEGMGMTQLDHRGFTLIEMVIVTALISIMLVVAIPRLDRGLFANNTNETARWLIANVRRLKEKAVSDKKTYLLNISTDTQRMWITAADMTDTAVDAAGGTGYRLPAGLSIEQVSFSRNEPFYSDIIPIGFYPQGYSDKAAIRMRTDDGDRLTFFIEPFLPGVRLVQGNQG